MALLSLLDVWKSYDANRPLLEGVTFVVRENDRIGLIGPNGAGKSTLLRLLIGREAPERGERVQRRGLHLGYLEQEPRFEPGQTVRSAVHAGLEGREELLADIEELHTNLEQPDLEQAELARLLRRQERLQARLDELGGHEVEHLVEATIHGVGLLDPEADCETLSGGEARRVALARLLVSEPDLLLLDEPTNHLDAFVIDWLEKRLSRLDLPLILVTHDRYLLERTVDRIVEIDRGKLYTYEGGYGRYLEQRAARLEVEQREERTRLNLLRRETAWMRVQPLARTTRAKARVARYDALVDAAPERAAADLELSFLPERELGNKVVRLHGVSHRYGERVVLPRLDLELTPDMRLGIVGPNGAGKSTLLRILLGTLEPSEGTVEIGTTVRFGTVDQRREDLDLEHTVVEEVAGDSDHVAVGAHRIHVASFLDRFLFPGAKKNMLIKSLSGGERGRVLLAKLLLAGGNVLVLDEPTNDLDLATLRALEEALLQFPGALVVVSHDRFFLDRVATHVLHLDGRGGVRLHTGSVSSLLEQHLEQAASEAKASRAAEKRSASRAKTAAAPKDTLPSPVKKRLTPWEERELEELTGQVGELEDALGGFDERLGDPALYQAGGQAARELQAERDQVQAQLTQALERWEELAERA